jgi:large repetitive protein
MRKRIFYLIAIGSLFIVIITGCGHKAEPTETVAPPIGAVAGIPEETPAPTPTPTPTLTPTAEPTPAATPTPEPTPIPTPTPSPPAQSTPLTILAITSGEIWVMSAGTDTWHQATVETTLQPGDTIKSGSSSKAEITFFEGSTIELEASAEIAVSEIGISETGSTTIRLSQRLGKTISRVKKLVDADSHYEIETPAAIAAVRGSTMIVTVDNTGKTVVANQSGDIRIIVDNQEYIIHEGMQRSVKPGELPSEETWTNPPSGGGGGGSPALQSRMEVTMQAEPLEAHVGDTITYTYNLHNIGDLPFHDISVSNSVAGNATYQSGDVNDISVLNPEETWVFTSTYTVKAGDPSTLVATATISATTSTSVTVVDTETATTTIHNPGIAIDKTADRAMAHVGDNITYTYTITNAGNIPLTIISLTDNLIQAITFVSGDSNGDERLDIGETWVFSANYTVTSDDPNLLMNTASVYGMDNSEQYVNASDNASVSILKPGIALDKSASPGQVHVGDNITYTYMVTNAGNTQLSNITLADNLTDNITFVSGDSNGDERLDIEETWVFSANYTVTSDDTSPLENTANVSGRDALLLTVTSEDNASVAILRPGIALDKSADASFVHVGDNITYTYEVTNAGNTPLANILVTDNRIDNVNYQSGDSNEDELLDVEENWVFSSNYTVGGDDPDLLMNTANVTGRDALSLLVSSADEVSVSVLRPGITLDKSANASFVHVGDNITYTYEVTNNGNTPLVNILVTDNQIDNVNYTSGDSNEDGLLDVEETWIFSSNYTVGAEDPDLLVNTANVTGRDALEKTVTASDSASAAILRPGIDIDKTASPEMAHVGDNIIYTYEVTNNGNTPLGNIQVTDNRIDNIAFTSGDINEDTLLDVEETWVFTANYIVGSNDPDLLVNTANVTGRDALSLLVTAEDDASVSVLSPGIALDKSSDREEAFVGDIITYTYIVTNTGNLPIAELSVSDDRIDNVTYVSGDINGNRVLEATETWVYTAYYTVSVEDTGGDLENIAVVSGVDALLHSVTASDSASVTIIILS